MKTKIFFSVTCMLVFLTCSHLLNAKTINHTPIAAKKVENPGDKKIKENYQLKTCIIDLNENNETMLENEKNYLYSLILSGTATDEQIARYNELSEKLNKEANKNNNALSTFINQLKKLQSFDIDEYIDLLENYITSKINNAFLFSVSDSGNIIIIEE